MDPEKYDRVCRIVDAAVDLPADSRREYVEGACGGDAELRAEVEVALEEFASPSSFLSRAPLAGVLDEFVRTPEEGELAEEGQTYRLLRLIGRGGMGRVYLAEQQHPRRHVALKILEPSLVGPSGVRRFEQEAQFLGRVQHPGIAQIHDAGTLQTPNGPRPYIAMQYVEGESMSRRLNCEREGARIATGGNDSEQAREADGDSTDAGLATKPTRDQLRWWIRCVEKVARALHAAHEAGIVHRDVKPQNVMITPQGEPILLDFGIARDTEGEFETLTVTGPPVGTLAYMSPEQLAGERQHVDRRTDVWSLGVMLYQCLCHRRPFIAPTDAELTQAIRVDEPRAPRSLNPAVPRDLEAVLQTALEKDRRKRYQTAQTFADDLARVLEGSPVSVKPLSSMTRAARWVKRRPRQAALVGALLGAVLVATISATVASVTLPGHLRQERDREALAAIEDGLKTLAFEDIFFDYPSGELKVSFPGREERIARALQRMRGAARSETYRFPAVASLVIGHLAQYHRRNPSPEPARETLAVLDAFPELAEAHPALNLFRALALRILGDVGEAEAIEGRLRGVEFETSEDFYIEGHILLHQLLARDDAPAGGARSQEEASLAARALEKFEKALRFPSPERFVYHLGRIAAANIRGDAAARDESLHILTRPPFASPSILLLAATHMVSSRDQDALRLFEEATRYDLSDADRLIVSFVRGQVHLRLQEWRDAERAFRTVERIEPDFAHNCARLGVALVQMGRPAEALRQYERALALGYPEAELGRIVERLRPQAAYDEKASAMERGEWSPSSAEDHRYLAELFFRRGQHRLADRHYAQALAIDENVYRGDTDQRLFAVRAALTVAFQLGDEPARARAAEWMRRELDYWFELIDGSLAKPDQNGRADLERVIRTARTLPEFAPVRGDPAEAPPEWDDIWRNVDELLGLLDQE